MAKSRTITTNLSRVFDQSDALVYVVRSQIGSGNATLGDLPRIVYANEACLAWVGLPFTELKDTRLVYSASPLENTAEDRLRGLAPPFPIAQAGGESEPFSVFHSPPGEGRTLWRMASLRRIYPGDASPPHTGDWLVIADPPDLPAPPAREATPGARDLSSPQLHELLQQLNDQFADSHRLDQLAGESPFALGLRRTVAAAIASPLLDVLIVGPAGSGREHVARTLFHQRHRDSPATRLVPLDGDLADPPLVQEVVKEILGGYRLSPPRHDCLLLRNVDRLSHAAQVELAGFLNLPGARIPTLATATQPLDATRNDPVLTALTGVLVVELIPLTERLPDVPLLAQAILESGNREPGRQRVGFAKATLQMFLEHDWPGNLDELRSVVKAAAANCPGAEIKPEHLPAPFTAALRAARVPSRPERRIDLTQYLQGIERVLVERALEQAGGNKSQASRMLGISRPRLLRRLSQLGLDHWLEPAPSDKPARDQVDSSAFVESDE